MGGRRDAQEKVSPAIVVQDCEEWFFAHLGQPQREIRGCANLFDDFGAPVAPFPFYCQAAIQVGHLM